MHQWFWVDAKIIEGCVCKTSANQKGPLRGVKSKYITFMPRRRPVNKTKIGMMKWFSVSTLKSVAASAFCCTLLTCCSSAKLGYEPGTFRMNLGNEPSSLDWLVTTDTNSFDVISNIMVGLTQYTSDLKCAPSCASSWDVLDGGKRYVFHLRNDVLWSDGKTVCAQDFEYAWKRLLNPLTAAQYAYFLYDIQNAFEYNTGKIKDQNLVGVRAIDDRTLEIKLKKPAAYFLYLTAFCPTFPQRKDVIERFGDRWTDPDKIVSNGPFLLDRWQHEYKIELKANPNFFEGPPTLNRIKMFMVPEQSTAFALYENDELDYVDNRSFSTADVERFKNSSEYRNVPLLRATYLGFNVTKKPFTDVRVRKAIGMAVDKTVFAQILRRRELPADGWIPKALAGYSKDSGLPFDPKKARQLLAEAGYEGGKNFPSVSLLYPTREDTKLVVEAVQAQLKKNLGVRIHLSNNEWKVYLDNLRRNPPEIFRSSWGADYPDPETFMNLFTSYNGNNDTKWGNKKYDSLVERASAEQDPELRAELYRQADHLLCVEEVAMVPTYWSTQNAMVKPWVEGMEFNALDVTFLKRVKVGARGEGTAGVKGD